MNVVRIPGGLCPFPQTGGFLATTTLAQSRGSAPGSADPTNRRIDARRPAPQQTRSHSRRQAEDKSP